VSDRSTGVTAGAEGKPRAEFMAAIGATDFREMTPRDGCSLPACVEMPRVWLAKSQRLGPGIDAQERGALTHRTIQKIGWCGHP